MISYNFPITDHDSYRSITSHYHEINVVYSVCERKKTEFKVVYLQAFPVPLLVIIAPCMAGKGGSMYCQSKSREHMRKVTD